MNFIGRTSNRARVLREGALPKVPGISATRLQKIVDKYRQFIVDAVTDTYDGANWIAVWRITDGEETTIRGDATIAVTDAELVSAQGEYDAADGPLELGLEYELTKRDRSAGMADVVGPVIAKALNGTWDATAWFAGALGPDAAWSSGAEKIGDTYETESDLSALFRMGVRGAAKGLPHMYKAVEAPIRLKVRASYSKRDKEVRVRAISFKTI